jgi:glycosyltransferase involved in cell wall biosynthesis
MRIAYLTNSDFEKQTGVTKKILAQSERWREFGNTVWVFSCSHGAIRSEGLTQYDVGAPGFRWKRMRAPALISDITAFDPDLIYLRFEPYKGFFDQLRAWPVVLEVNSDEISEYVALARDVLFQAKKRTFFEFARHVRSAARRLYEAAYAKSTRARMISLCSGYVFPTVELRRKWKVGKAGESVVIPNSIELGIGRSASATPKDGLRLVFMGMPGSTLWHGTDILLKLASKLPADMSVDIIGLEGEDRRGIKFHGYLSASDYEDMLGKATVGVGTLALFRKKMSEACPLKTREYLAYGLPVILGYKDSAFDNKRLPEWALRVPNNDSWPEDPAWIERVVDFVRRMDGRKVRTQECAGYIDAAVLEPRRLEFMSRVVAGGA